MKEGIAPFFCVILFLGFFTVPSTASCEDDALGIESKTIPDGQLTSSSSFNASTPAINARLNIVGLPWCAVESRTPLYLQVDLGSLHAVCAVATQGNSKADQWVETYQLQTSTDGTTWTNYEEGGQVREFQGNADSSTTVKQILFEGVVSRYVRVVPKTCREFCCLRVELYGALESSCQNTAVEIADRSKIPDHRMTATSVYSYHSYGAHEGRFSTTNCGWGARTSFTGNDYLQVDLGGVHFICALATKGCSCSYQEWTEKYKIYLSLDNKSWNTYKENGVDKTFIGNTDKTTVKKNNVPSLPRAKFIRFWPTDVHSWAVLRVEVYGAAQACHSSLGMEDNSINDSQITAQPNTNTPSNGRLYKTSTWCSSDINAGYLQIDLGQVKTITGVATQGHHSSDKWVKTYKISYKYDSSLSASWQDYKLNESGPVMTIDGNVNKNGVRVNWFPVPFVARYIRVIADSWTPSSSGPCLRIDLYGCDRGLLVTCPRLSVSSNVTVSPSSCTQSNSSVGAVCSFSCARGYRRIGPPSINCTGNGAWTDQSANVICEDERVVVNCGKEEMSISLPKSLLRGLDRHHLRLINASCQATETASHYTLKTPLTGCGTTSRHTNTSVVYTNEVVEIPGDQEAIIRRERKGGISFSCYYDNNGVVSTVGLEPTNRKQVFSGKGNFTLSLDMFPDQRFTASFSDSDFPVVVLLRQRLYFQVSMTSADQQLSIMAQRCFATPTQDENGPTKYEFITDGCPEDDTLQFPPAPSGHHQRFSLEAFEFIAENPFVFIHCEVKVCNATNPDSACVRGCSSRARRAADPVPTNESPLYSLAQGPIVLKRNDENEPADDIANNGVSSEPPLIVLVLLCVVSLAGTDAWR